MLRDSINNALKEAMKSRDERRVSTLRLMNAAIQNADLEASGLSKPLMSPKQDDSGWTEPKATALLVLADGTVLEGMGLGATSLAVTRSDKDSALPPGDSYFISSVITC